MARVKSKRNPGAQLRYSPIDPAKPDPREIATLRTPPRNPPGDDPKITDAERIRFIDMKAPDADLVTRAGTEPYRIARKKVWAVDQPDRADRDASADASMQEIFPIIMKHAHGGAAHKRRVVALQRKGTNKRRYPDAERQAWIAKARDMSSALSISAKAKRIADAQDGTKASARTIRRALSRGS